VAVDLDRDGLIDVASICSDSTSVSILKGDGHGGLGMAAGVTTPASTLGSIVAADFDADGRMDLAIGGGAVAGRSGQGSVTVLRGNGDGTFKAPLMVLGLDPVGPITAADLNGDGRIDLGVETNRSAMKVSPYGVGNVLVLIGLGTGTFKSPVVYPVGSVPLGLRAADLDGNGALDLVGVNNQDNNIFVRLNAGDGTFASSTLVGMGLPVTAFPRPNPNALIARDLDGDGRIDLAVANAGTADVVLIYNNTTP
jgi:hypothetical protein